MIKQSLSEAMQKEMLTDFPSEASAILENISAVDGKKILESQTHQVVAPTINKLSPQTILKIVAQMDDEQAVTLFNSISANRLSMVFACFDDRQRDVYLQKIDSSLSEEVTELLKYPENTAGSIMDRQFTLYRPGMSVRETLSRFRRSKKAGRRVIFLTDANRQLQGYVEIQDILMVSPDTRLSAIAKPITYLASDISLTEEVVQILEQSKLSELPVINVDGEVVGIIRYDALVQAAKEDASVDIQTMVGVSKDERALSKVSFAVKKRLPWLEINLVTAFIAASVVGFFEATIAKYTALAILLPVVAGQSGNTGAQALAVTMRGLALREIRTRHWPKIVWKEANIGLINGIAVALTTALGVYVWSQSYGLAIIICSSMVISMVLASISGALVPIVLSKLGQDPAQSSSIILTTITDVVGFLSFLGIASALTGLL